MPRGKRVPDSIAQPTDPEDLETRLAELQSQLEELQQKQGIYDGLALRYPEVWRRMQEGKFFLIIEPEQPFFYPTYLAIRNDAKQFRRWTALDELQFNEIRKQIFSGRDMQ